MRTGNAETASRQGAGVVCRSSDRDLDTCPNQSGICPGDGAGTSHGSTPINRTAREAAALRRFGWSSGGVRCVCLQLFIGEDEAADVAQRLFPDGHLLEVVLPQGVGGGPRGAAGEGFATDGDGLAAAIEAGVLLRGENEADLRALLPEIAGEIVGKEQRVVAPAAGEDGNGVIQVRPLGLDVGLVPLA